MAYIDPQEPLRDEVRVAGDAVTGIAQFHAVIRWTCDVGEQRVGTDAEGGHFVEFNGLIRALLPQDNAGVCTPSAAFPPHMGTAFNEIAARRVGERLVVVGPTLSRCRVR